MNNQEERNDSENGQSLVEFTFSLIVLVILLAGLVDLGRALFTYMALRDAAQEGALYGSFTPADTAGIQDRMYQNSNLLASLEGTGLIDINITHDGTPCTGEAITIEITHNSFPITMPFLGSLLGSQTIHITASVTDTILAPGCT